MIGAIILLLVFYAILVGIYYGYKVSSLDKSACFGLSAECYDEKKKKKNNEAHDIALLDKCQEALKPWAEEFFGMFSQACLVSPGSLDKCYEDLTLENPDMFGEGGTHSYITENIMGLMEREGKIDLSGFFRHFAAREEIIKSYKHCNSVVEKKIKFKTSWLYFGDGF
jgi:hypothetical protein